MSLYLNNIFYSIQGEGLEIGKPTIFVRFAGCPFRCPYCDEPAALTKKNSKEYTAMSLFEEVVKLIRQYRCSTIELTGGSPEAQDQKELYDFCRLLKNYSNISISIQMSGGIKISKDLHNIIDRKKIDYKEPSCKINFIIEKNNLTEYDEIKFVADIDGKNWEWLFETLKEFYYTPAAIIISPKSSKEYYNELDNCKVLTEQLLLNYNILKRNIQIMPRLQQLYWYNVKGK